MNNRERIGWMLQLTYLLLYEGGVVCALVQKGHLAFTLGLMVMAPVLMLLSRIPDRFFPSLLRQVLQLVIVGLALAWFQDRSTSTQMDLALVECAAILGQSLFISCRQRGHALLSVLSIGFAGYGGLTPGRLVYLPAFFAVCGIYLVIMYQTRNQLLIGGDGIAANRPRYWGNWLYRGLHVVLALALAYYGLTHFRLRRKLVTRGVVPVSFLSDQDLEFPQMWGDWFKPMQKVVEERDISRLVESTPEHAPTAFARHAKKEVKDSKSDAMNARDGAGAALKLSTDLVFRAYSPARLYWVMQMYDTYDGNQWTRSVSMTKGRNALDEFVPDKVYEVIQTISLEKVTSERLPYAFRGVSILQRGDAYNGSSCVLMLKADAVTFGMRNMERVQAPLLYRIQSFVPAPDLQPPIRAWNEPRRNCGWNYRQVPQKLISQRVRLLADQLVAGMDTPRQKADAIRDYLKENYRYNIKARSVPSDRETIDYFLFTQKEGYCQHFAQAMVVLARLAGLQARLVTGYTPGKYNSVANYFEVFEYNAHAWAQVFIEPYGWLTYDAVAPGDLPIPAEKKMLSAILDPFADQMDSKPPELSFEPYKDQKEYRTRIRPQSGKMAASFNEMPVLSGSDNRHLMDEINDLAMAKSKTGQPTLKDLSLAVCIVVGGKIKLQWSALLEFAGERVRMWKDWLLEKLKQLLLQLFSCNEFLQIAMLAALAMPILALAMRRKLAAWWRRRLCVWRCRRLWRRIQAGKDSPRRTLALCQRLLNEQLRLCGFQRRPHLDALECGEALKAASVKGAEDYSLVAAVVLRTLYAGQEPSPDECKDAVRATGHFCVATKNLQKA